jgi:hypothetical protein
MKNGDGNDLREAAQPFAEKLARWKEWELSENGCGPGTVMVVPKSLVEALVAALERDR